MRPSLATLLVALILAIPAMAQFVEPLVIGGAQPHIVSTKITQVAFCSNNTCSFSPGTTNAIGQGVVALSNGGMFSGTWTMPTTGTATNPPGASCPDNSAFFTISSAGVLTSTAQSAAQSYSVCVGASQAGLSPPNPYIQVVTLAPGVPCNIGPTYVGIIPAAAVQAGMTTCAANYDFTFTGSFTDDVGTHQWSNLSTWLSCSGTVAAPFLWRNRGAVSCDTSHQNVQMDGNIQVLAMTYYLTDWNAGHYNNTMTNEAPGVTSDQANILPQQGYLELVARQSSTSGNCGFNSGTGSSFCQVFDSSTFTDVSGNPCFVARDMEFDDSAPTNTVTGIGFAAWNCGLPSTGAGPVSNNDIQHGTSYNTGGHLQTADNVNAYGGCDYWAAGAVSGLPKAAFGSCLQNGPYGVSGSKYTIIPPASSSIFGTRMYQYFENGPNNANGGAWISTSYTTYIQRLTIWECSGWKTGPCITNPVVTTAPP